jgi:uncharacterized lipoprotein YbaY
MAKPLVSGDIRFTQLPRLPPSAKAYVRLLDTSMADAPARLVAETVLEGISDEATRGNPIPFAIYGDLESERASYSVSVLVDVDGDGKTSPGDFINMQSYPVLTYGYPAYVSVEVREVP